MKSIKIFFSVFAFFLMITSCEKDELVKMDPQLKIIVKDVNNNLVTGASVDLFISFEDFQAESNSILSDTTNKDGVVLFSGLEESDYFFYVEYNEKNNFFGVAGTSNPLEIGVITIIETIIQ